MPDRQVRVNIRALANSAEIRKEKRNGREKIIVPSATLPDDVIMNQILYPADEIEASYASLNNTPAPLGHPMIDNKFVSASEPEGINIGWIGAHNENVRRENGRVFIDKVIDVEVANRSEGGKAVLNAIEKGEPIHTSTGLMCFLENAAEGADHKYIAREMEFDHDAILLNEAGAATPDQGVGMMVNASGDQVEVINSAVDMADQELDWAGMHLLSALERRERASVWERMKTVILEALTPGRETPTNHEGDVEMAVTDEQFKELSDKVQNLADSFDKIGETVANSIGEAVKPLTDNLNEMQANQKAKDDAELADLVSKIVKANLLDEDSAKELTLNAARALAKRAEPGKAAGLNAANFDAQGEADEFEGVDLNAGMEGK